MRNVSIKVIAVFLMIIIAGLATAQAGDGVNPKPAGSVVGKPIPAAGGGALTDPAVAILADSDDGLADVRQKLLDTGKISTVATYNLGSVGVPTIGELMSYNAVMIWGGASSWGPAINTAMGNVLAEYCDLGGGVVVATFCLGSNLGSWILSGMWDDPTYQCIIPATNQDAGQAFLGTVHEPSHDLMLDVTTFDGGSSSYRIDTTVAGDATLIASWSDGKPLIAVKEVGVARRCDLNFYPPSSTVRSDFWNVTTDGDEIMANALAWVSQMVTSVETSTWSAVKVNW